MRHRKAGARLNMSSSHRQAMFRNMVTSLLKHDRIRTTDARAKELRRWADHVITLAKKGDLHARRQALAIVREKDIVHKLFEEAQQRFGKINGGYTRITKIGRRPGDAALISVIELVSSEEKPKKKKKKGKPAAKKTAPVAPSATDTEVKETAEEAVETAESEQAEASAEAAVGETDAVEAEAASEEEDQTEEAEAKAQAPEAEAEEATAEEAEAPSEPDVDEESEKKQD